MGRKTFDPKKSIYTKFYDDIGDHVYQEDTIDQKGVSREFFSLVLQQLHNSALFEGPLHEKHLALNHKAIEQNHYHYAGVLISMSLLQGGPCPQFFSRDLTHIICGETNYVSTIVEAEANAYLLTLINSIHNCEEGVEAIKDMIRSSEAEVSGVIPRISNLMDKDSIIEEIVRFYKIDRVSVPLEQLLKGMREMGVLNLIQGNPELAPSIFVKPPTPTANEVSEMFLPFRSEKGSNKFALESRILSFWITYLEDCEDDVTGVKIEQILQFSLGTTSVPAMGFPFQPNIVFLHEEKQKSLPVGHTCSLVIDLPVCHATAEKFSAACNTAFLQPLVFDIA